MKANRKQRLIASALALALITGTMIPTTATVAVVTASTEENAPVAYSTTDEKIWGDYKYTVLNDGTVEIAGYTGSDYDLAIPSKIDGRKVTSIGDRAFSTAIYPKCKNFVSITIPDGVTSIGYKAFLECSNLANINVPNSVETIDVSAFDDTAWYTGQPDGLVYVGKVAYRYKGAPGFGPDEPDALPKNTSIEIKDGTKSISPCAFMYCTNLTSITIPSSVDSIGNNAFWGCYKLKEINLNDGLKSIGDGAFGSWPREVDGRPRNEVLTKIDIPDSVTYIGIRAFWGYEKIESVTIPKNVSEIDSHAFGYYDISYFDHSCTVDDFTVYGYSGTAAETYANKNNFIFVDLDSAENTNNISWNIDTNGTLTFSGTGVINPDGGSNEEKFPWYVYRESIKNVVIEDGITGIGDYTCFNLKNLESITISESVTNIGEFAFLLCNSLESINVAYNNTSYTSVDGVLFNKDMTEIVKYPNNRSGKYTIPNTVQVINKNAFRECAKLTEVAIPDSVTTIMWGAFFDCTSLSSIAIPENVTDIDAGCGIGYKFNKTVWLRKPSFDGFIIYGTEDTAAEKYANENSITFKTIDIVKPLINNSTITATSVTAGTAITINAKAAEGTVPYKYYYYCKAPGSNKYVEMKTDVKATSRSTKPTVAGTYYYSVKIVDANGNYKTKIFTVKVNPALENNSTISATNIELGSPITLKASATGGTAPYKYYYYYKASTDTKWIKLSADTSATSRVTKPTGLKTYNYKINVVDASGTIKSKIFTVKVNPKLNNNSTISATNIELGDSVTLKASATGGKAPYKYYYYYKASNDTKWIKLNASTSATSRVTTPTGVKTYNYKINVVDANGTIKSKTFTVKVNKVTNGLVNNSTISATSVELGESITLKASATGGKAPYKYYYYYKASNDTKWIKLNTDTSAKSRVTTPTGIKTYNYKINIVDDNGTLKSKTFTVTCTASAEVKKVAEIVNSERKANGLSAITLDTELCNAAAIRSRELVKLFDHVRPDGTDCFTVLKQLGISYMCAGENIAAGYPSPESVMNGWMNSPGHRANILTSEFSKIGVGLYNYNGYKYWVQLFVG